MHSRHASCHGSLYVFGLFVCAALTAGGCTHQEPIVPLEPTNIAALPPPPAPPPGAPRSLPPPVAPPPPRAVCTAFAPSGAIRRAAVTRTVEAGLGRWLGGVEVEAGVHNRRFRGWVVRKLYPDDACYRDVDLRPGDLVLRINGRPVERPEQANEVFASLLTANSIVVEYLREGKPRKLVFSIADR